MTIASLPEPGRNGENEATFNPKMYAFVEALYQVFLDLPADLNNVAASVLAVQASLAAGLFDPSHAYAQGERAFSRLAGGFLYRRKSAGTSATDPLNDSANWDPLTLMGYPLVIVNASTHVIVPNTCVVITYAGPVTLTAPAAAGDTQFAVKRANGRLDNVLTAAEPIEGQASGIYLDGPWSDGLWRYFGAAYGYGRY